MIRYSGIEFTSPESDSSDLVGTTDIALRDSENAKNRHPALPLSPSTPDTDLRLFASKQSPDKYSLDTFTFTLLMAER